MIEWIVDLDVVSPNKKSWGISPRNAAGIQSRRNKSNARLLGGFWMLVKDKPIPPCVISIQRLYNPKKREKRWDDDNWVSACKSIRDSIASLIVPNLPPGQADHPSRGLSFMYEQITSIHKGVRIRILEEWEMQQAIQDSFEQKKNGDIRIL